VISVFVLQDNILSYYQHSARSVGKKEVIVVFSRSSTEVLFASGVHL